MLETCVTLSPLFARLFLAEPQAWRSFYLYVAQSCPGLPLPSATDLALQHIPCSTVLLCDLDESVCTT